MAEKRFSLPSNNNRFSTCSPSVAETDYQIYDTIRTHPPPVPSDIPVYQAPHNPEYSSAVTDSTTVVQTVVGGVGDHSGMGNAYGLYEDVNDIRRRAPPVHIRVATSGEGGSISADVRQYEELEESELIELRNRPPGVYTRLSKESI